jgi:peptidoglycan/LPS O-acetylase OafA/YrhL
MSLEQQPRIAAGPYALSEASSFTLDLIRTIAAQLVLVGHSISILGLLPWLQPPHFAYIQNIAVVVFFLLSGLLISYSVFSRPQWPTFTSYLIDRFARIYSGLIPALIFIAIADGAIIYGLKGDYQYWSGYSVLDFVGNALMLQDYPGLGSALGITSFGSARVLWTLAVEWWLYMLFGWLVLSRARGLGFWIVLALLLPVPLYNVIAGRGDGLTSMWMIGLGCCLALRSNALRLPSVRTGWLLFLGLGLIACARIVATKDAYDLLFAVLSAFALTTLILVLDSSALRIPAALERLVRFTADYSFTLYLVHLSVIALLLNFTGGLSPWAVFGVLFVASNIAAALLALKTEMQHRKLRRLLKRKLDPAPAPAGQAPELKERTP